MSAAQLDAVDLATAIDRGQFLVIFAHATFFIQNQGKFFIGLLANVRPKRSAAVTKTVSNLFPNFYTGIADVVTTRDSNNKIFTDKLPPSFHIILQPFALAACAR